ncbi:hypothetical protein RhiirA5_503450 [Rhizophagus irregularis]|uniref:Histone-lysine N-methyltransferase SET5 n=3 Tax=Rhizophagus irregularis TaxID=588596 RepID=A0A2N0R9I4_9GLOM|nr:hypothetical protein GLOIN_2v1868177 [Rhizophagus irregularis DAOM 181602=DAOM 197198]EXX52309.1 hypothetical protein RirG_254130 [Rhizophagus irregularis DAOM 197198w]PKC03404.1 hypothetical protein RhiirA5_503450 [Rhizophagus irregularis]PKC59972.1 hypothetical protein RhiirA1_540150 [Rhizophagus irregularis]POG81381.1 hypothetical protein GLOIN_2v1868177 [Rhizophagus irregularis DAOM 181602=DAOM 197198]UZO02875.1 hypothetical protein OCT59_021353 [Rhizophagus irregularis]|eukprot:XP_025188247.1 hypothetical protein GLOIN_2v1868177 [Rhizophagus irregularis DAOM 181602=DAOM 197198]
MQSLDHRENGNEAIKRGDYISAWEHYTEGLKLTPKDPYLWCNRAFACLKAGYPELALHDSANSENILTEYPEQDFKDNIDLFKLKLKGKYRIGEAYGVLGLPKHAAFEYKACMDLAKKEDPSMKSYTKNDFNIWEKKKEDYYKTSLLHDQFIQTCQITEAKKRHGFYKFEGKYPWDKRNEERTSEKMIEKLQQKLDSASNFLLRISKIRFNDSDSEQLGLVVKTTINKSRLTLQEDPFLTAHNYYVFRCDYCFQELNEPGSTPYESLNLYEKPKKVDPYYCPKRSCEEVFCSERCYNLSLNLYHKSLCGKDKEIKEIVDIINSDNIGVLHHLMLTVRIFAVAKIRDICPLDVEEIKHLCRFTPVSTPFRGKMIYDPSFYEIYLNILRIIEVSRFDLRYDYWIFITVINMVLPNSFPGPGDSDVIDTLALYPLSSLVNHCCIPSFFDAQYLSQDYDSSPGPIRDNIRMRCKIDDVDNLFHPARIFFVPSREIEEGEQVLKSYCDPRQRIIERHNGLVTTFGFICKCERCVYENGEANQEPVNWHFHFPVIPDWVKKYDN